MKRRMAHGLDRVRPKGVLTFLRNSKGATAIEYGLIAALIAVAAIAAFRGVGGQVGRTFNNVTTNIKVAS